MMNYPYSWRTEIRKPNRYCLAYYYCYGELVNEVLHVFQNLKDRDAYVKSFNEHFETFGHFRNGKIETISLSEARQLIEKTAIAGGTEIVPTVIEHEPGDSNANYYVQHIMETKMKSNAVITEKDCSCPSST